ncbi:MAG TPA: hypothetical protein VIG86_02070 [Candidatus Dormibacteraeota bacterium]|jgi:hypothetical protein
MAVEITDERIAAAAARLHEGGWWFTPRQLYYAVCADVESAPVRIASGEVGLGLVLIMIGIVLANRAVLVVLGGLGVLLIAVGAITHLQERRPPPLGRVLAISFAEFEARLAAGATPVPGMISPTQRPHPQSGSGALLVICDRAETAAILTANREHLGDARVLTVDEAPADVSALSVVVLHDCDPVGCAIAADLRDRGADIGDAGINPAEVIGKRAQLIEGAPARLPRDLSGHLTVPELDWLLSGRRLELATQTPEHTVVRVLAAGKG